MNSHFPFCFSQAVPGFSSCLTDYFSCLFVVDLESLAFPLIWFYLQREIGTVKFSSFHFLNPFFGVSLSFLVLGEMLSGFDIIGILIVMLGLYLVQNSKESIENKDLNS